MADYGELLRAAREREGLKVRELAAMFQTSETLIYKWEKGTKSPSADTLRKYVEHGLMTADAALMGDDAGEAA